MSVNVQLYIDGNWREGAGKKRIPLENPATNGEIGTIACADTADLEEAVMAADKAFRLWRATPAFDRGNIIKKAGQILERRRAEIAVLLTREQGKPLAEANMEIANSVNLIEWFGEEARRTYGRIVPARLAGVSQQVFKEPVGPVAAFTPWNFPIAQSTRKIAAALAAGCTIVLKGAEETPSSCAALVECFAEAGVPKGVLNLVFGEPAEISAYLIPHDKIRKVSFTGSTAVGKQLAELAGRHMKRSTFELGGHAPVLVFADTNLDAAVTKLVSAKYRNAGQVCISPTRILVQDQIFDEFTENFVAQAKKIKVGSGEEEGTMMGPLANPRRIQAMETMLTDAKRQGAEVLTGGARVGNTGNFFEPTVIANSPKTAMAMNEEPFGPLALMVRFGDVDEAIDEANRLPYGLASYAYTSSAATARAVSERIESGMLSINHHGLGVPEAPFGGIKDSGYGSEGGTEAMEAYLVTKFVSHLAA